ncbi:MAG TPA: DEAD/DEAH box helicase [Pseudorhodoplanes sp.]|nr:DEAD/DEAH box helicase [Pseudorhodoplanes sp.]
MNDFENLGLAAPITRALAEERYVTPTPIQAQTIPHVMNGRDVIGIAQTGTGKTAAFALPILDRLAASQAPLEKKSCRVLVLSPTRELSAQIVDSFRTYGRHLRIGVALAIGGVSMRPQVQRLMSGVDVLVATPGRLNDLIQSNALRLNKVEVFVLDEADRMLDMGFIHDIRKIVTRLPKERQTLFFSATMPPAASELAAQMLRNPAKVAVTPVATTAERVEQRVILVDRAGKSSLLAALLRSEPIDRAIVFTRTKHGADKVVRHLGKAGLAAHAIHGNKSQNQRERALADFRKGTIRTLVATDIAARGIDVDGVSHVFNYDLPNVPESYVHRIGRTARAGATGVAISFCDAEERAYLRDIEKLIRMTVPSTLHRSEQPQEQRAHGRQPAPHRAEQPKEQKAHGRQHLRQDRPHAESRAKHERPRTGRRPEHKEAQPAAQRNRTPQQAPRFGDIASVAFLNAGQKSYI